MPFSKKNRIATILVVAIVIVLTIGVTGIVSVANHLKTGSTPVITSIVGFVGIAINQFLGMLRAEIARKDQNTKADETQNLITNKANEIKEHAESAKNAAQEANKTAQEASKVAQATLQTTSKQLEEIKEKVNGNLETAVDKAVQAERHQVLDQLPLPKTNEELEAMIKKIVLQTAQQIKKN